MVIYFELHSPLMPKRPLVTLVVVFAAILMAMSFAMVAFPEHIEAMSLVSGVVAVGAIVVLVVMFLHFRKI